MSKQRVCPKCGGNRLITSDDRTRPPSGFRAMMAIYHKKYDCKDCKEQFTD